MAKCDDDGYVSVWVDPVGKSVRERKLALQSRTAPASVARPDPAGETDDTPPVRVKRGRRRKKAASRPGVGYEGQRKLVRETVDNPFHASQGDAHRFETVTRNVLHDPIEHMYSRGTIGDAQRAAGMRVRELVEALGLDAVRSLVLDGAGCGGLRCEIADHRLDAGRKMRALRDALGADMTDLLVRVAGYGVPITVVAADYDEDPAGAANGACSKSARNGVGFMLRRALTLAAEHFGYRTRAPGPRGLSSWMGEGARPSISESDERAAQTG